MLSELSALSVLFVLACCVCRLNALQEIWVPSEWQKQSFIASGVDATKLVVVPEVGWGS